MTERGGEAKRRAARRAFVHAVARRLGPGLITGASDDDPSGIGTYAQTGALFGVQQLWLALYCIPLMYVVQEMCARIALQTGSGLAAVIRAVYPRPLLLLCVALLVIANTVNIGADLVAMAASVQLLAGADVRLWLVLIAVLAVLLALLVDYRTYANVLRLLTLSLLAYLLVVFLVPQDWPAMFRALLIPTLQWSKAYAMNLVAVLGTTISPYLFFWQANQETEEMARSGRLARVHREGSTRRELRWMRRDVAAGMVFSNVVMWAIILTGAATFHAHGVTQIADAVHAATVLQPLAGRFAALVFAAGIVGTGLLAVPVLAGSAAYAVAEAFDFRAGLHRTLREAPYFYGVIALATLLGMAMGFIRINPIQALYYTAVLNGLVAPVLLVLILRIAANPRIMQKKTNRPLSTVLGWFTVVLMSLAALALLVQGVWRYSYSCSCSCSCSYSCSCSCSCSCPFNLW
jgi:NRAMP (natural resistance-associated macrophage protein)-like metal ion transporter